MSCAAFAQYQGGNEGDTTLREPIHCGGRRKVPTMLHKLYSTQYICFRKTSSSNMRAPNSLLAPGAI